MINIQVVLYNSSESAVLEKFPLTIGREKTVGFLKQTIEARSDGGIIRMSYQGKVMEGSATLVGYGVQENSEIRVITDLREETINVIAQLISSSQNNKPVNIRCNLNEKSEELIAKIKAKIRFDSGSAYYTFNGNNLQIGRTLRDQGLSHNCTVSIGVSVRGGQHSVIL